MPRKMLTLHTSSAPDDIECTKSSTDCVINGMNHGFCASTKNMKMMPPPKSGKHHNNANSLEITKKSKGESERTLKGYNFGNAVTIHEA